MAGLEAFDEEIIAIEAMTFPMQGFWVRDYVDSWLAASRRNLGRPDADIINNAVTLAFYRQLANKHGAQMFLRARHGRGGHVSELPVLSPPFIHEDSDMLLHRYLSHKNGKYLGWMNSTRGMTTETAVHDGLRLLGATALVPGLVPTVNAGNQSRLLAVHESILNGLAPIPEGLL